MAARAKAWADAPFSLIETPSKTMNVVNVLPNASRYALWDLTAHSTESSCGHSLRF